MMRRLVIPLSFMLVCMFFGAGCKEKKPEIKLPEPPKNEAPAPKDEKKVTEEKVTGDQITLPTATDLKEYTKDLGEKGKLYAIIHTVMGDLECELFEDKVPMTVANFVGLARGLKAWRDPKTGEIVKKPFYNGLKFHRIIEKFMIQGGCPLGNGTGGPGYDFADEFVAELKHDKPGVLSMANSGPNTNGSQFFITEVPTPWLNGKHTIFGQCGPLDVIMKIAYLPKVPTNDPNNPPSIPVKDIFMDSVDIVRK